MLDNFNNLRGPVIDREVSGFYKIGNHAELIREAVLRVVFTRKGTRMGNLEFGTLIPDLAFTNNSEGLTNVLEFEISEAMAKWEPRAQFQAIQLMEIEDEFVRFFVTYRNLITNTVEELPVIAQFV